jgi:hypothetical protein
LIVNIYLLALLLLTRVVDACVPVLCSWSCSCLFTRCLNVTSCCYARSWVRSLDAAWYIRLPVFNFCLWKTKIARSRPVHRDRRHQPHAPLCRNVLTDETEPACHNPWLNVPSSYFPPLHPPAASSFRLPVLGIVHVPQFVIAGSVVARLRASHRSLRCFLVISPAGELGRFFACFASFVIQPKATAQTMMRMLRKMSGTVHMKESVLHSFWVCLSCSIRKDRWELTPHQCPHRID